MTVQDAAAANDAGPAPAPAAPVAQGSTTFAFQHKVFQTPGAVFRMDRTTQKVSLFMRVGEIDASLELRQIEKTFAITSDSPDGQMLQMVERSLRVVREIRPGDSVPNEVLGGLASWTVDQIHQKRARGKLIVQLVSWVTDGNSTLDSGVDVLEALNRPEVRERVNDALAAAAKNLDTPGADKGTVITMIGQLANELAYIEALRDKVAGYLYIKKRLKDVSHPFRNDRRVLDMVDRVNMLLSKPFAKLREQFQMVDAQTAEIMSALRRLQATIDFVRGVRDQLREFVLAWDDLDQRWIDVRIENISECEALISRTYRFLAQQYTPSQSWGSRLA